MRHVLYSAPFTADHPSSINTPTSTPKWPTLNPDSNPASQVSFLLAKVPDFSVSSSCWCLQRSFCIFHNPSSQNQHCQWYFLNAPRRLKVLESLEPNGTLESSSTDQEDFSQLQEWLPDNEASYTIYFLDNPPENYLFISYVPDSSNVPSPPSLLPSH